jgi:4-hydroxy-3-polyprenylbenzoate decarboxylase
VREAWSSALDPRIPPQEKAKGVTSHSKMIINACVPFAWKSHFPPASALSVEELSAVDAKWGGVLRQHA